VPRSRRGLVIVAVLAVIVLGGIAAIVSATTGSGRPASAVRTQSPGSVPPSSPATGAPSSQAGSAALCNSRRLAVDGGVYTVQNNEYDSGAPECLTVGTLGGFTVASSAIANSTSGAPGG
jgi:hypothetical protein